MSRLRDLSDHPSDEDRFHAGQFMGSDGELPVRKVSDSKLEDRASVPPQKPLKDPIKVRIQLKEKLAIEADVPGGYELSEHGVFLLTPKRRTLGTKRWKVEEDIPEQISGPVWVISLTRDNTAQAWGRRVAWIDADGNLHERAIPAFRFHEPGSQLAQELASEGLEIVPGKERQLTEYLGLYKPKARQKCVDHLGWLDTTDGGLVYVLPTQVITSVKITQSEHGDTSNGK